MYHRLVGKLIYLAHTRPDIAYLVSMINHFMHDPRESYLQVAYRVLQYLKGSPGKGVLFKRSQKLALEAYTDADYAGSIVNRRSTSGYCTFLAGNLATWYLRKGRYLKGTFHKLKTRMFGPCKVLKKISSNTYLIELPSDLQISPIFNVSDL
ncbi:hypothetical protein CFOL_v3_12240 [Cephalotus follicularis]|uniref:Tf2-1-like SH3-like domain-containing protein n=1 Tax=Cephalotus follicularis TaxID=3775 RepID=A0A1Q3BL45_CEPFO|nr:hypothetical protein CFOL_v3_12240 [Cephalotus follicularis]